MIVDRALYEDGRRATEDLELAAMVDRGHDAPDAFVWLGLFDPDDEELEEVAAVFDLHPLAVEDALHAHQRPKLERYGDSVFVVMKTVGTEDDGDDELDEVVQALEREVFTTGRHDLAARLYHAKRDVQTMRRAVAPFEVVTQQLVADLPHVDSSLEPYLRDVHDHVVRTRDRLSLLGELLDDALSTNVAQIGLRQNEDMRRISAWVGIVAVPTLIAGIYGMNFEHMPALGWRHGYLVVLGAMVVVATVLHRLFKRSGWL